MSGDTPRTHEGTHRPVAVEQDKAAEPLGKMLCYMLVQLEPFPFLICPAHADILTQPQFLAAERMGDSGTANNKIPVPIQST